MGVDFSLKLLCMSTIPIEQKLAGCLCYQEREHYTAYKKKKKKTLRLLQVHLYTLFTTLGAVRQSLCVTTRPLVLQ